jgi:hypothetical protein
MASRNTFVPRPVIRRMGMPTSPRPIGSAPGSCSIQPATFGLGR